MEALELFWEDLPEPEGRTSFTSLNISSEASMVFGSVLPSLMLGTMASVFLAYSRASMSDSILLGSVSKSAKGHIEYLTFLEGDREERE